MHLRNALAGLVLILPTALPAAAEVPLSGRVLDDQGKPLAGAEVALIRFPGSLERARLELSGEANPKPAATAKTGADGRYRLAAAEPGMWKVRVAARGFVPVERPLVPLVEAIEIEDAKLRRDAGLAVRVLGGDGGGGRPLAGARVAAEPAEERRFFGLEGWRPALRLAVTDAEGRAKLPRGDRERLRVRAVASGHPPAEAKPEGGSAELRFAAGCARAIDVREPAGGPAAGALVGIAAGGWTLGATDDTGRLTVGAPCDRELRLSVTAADGRAARATLAAVPRVQGAPTKREVPPLAVTLPGQPVRAAGLVLEKGSRAPLANAWVWPSGRPGDAVQSDPRGWYAMTVAPGAPLSLAAATPGHETGFGDAGTAPEAPAAGDAAGPTFALQPVAALAGRVVDEAGRPVARAEVRASSTDHSGGPGGFRVVVRDGLSGGPWTRSDDAGRFRLRVTPGTAYELAASHPDFAQAKLAVSPLEPRASKSDLRLVLPRGLAAVGRVVDGADQPVVRATVRLSPVSGDPGGPGALLAELLGSAAAEGAPEATTGADGRFAFEHLTAGRFDLAVTASGFAPVTVRGVEVAQGSGPADLGTVVLEPGATVEGRVVDRQGRPIPGAAISYRAAPAGGTVVRFATVFGREEAEPNATTDAQGRFELVDLTPGQRIAITVSKPGYAAGSLPGVETPTAAPVEIVLASAARVSGRVIDDEGEPVAGAQVNLTKEAARMVIGGRALPGMPAGRAATDAEGRFTIDGIEAGAVALEVTARGFRPAQRAGIQVREGEESAGIEVVLERGAVVAGRVLDASGTPVDGAQVSVVPEGGAGPLRFSRELVTTGGDGSYRLEGVEPGQRSIAAEHEDYPRAVRDLEVRPGDNRLEIRLGRGVEVEGLVLDVAGRPVPQATVELVAAGSFGGGPQATSDAAGAFRFVGVAPGAYRLQGQKPGFAPASLPEEVQVGALPVGGLELRLDAGGAIRGRIVGLTAEELSRVHVMALPAMPGGGRVALDMASARVDYAGEYRIEPLAAGDWTVIAELRDAGRRAQGRATLAPGTGEAVLDLEFGGGLALSGRVVKGGAAVPGAMVLARGRDVTASGAATTSADGAFRIEGLEAGTYDVTVAKLDSGLSHDESLTLDGDREVTIELPTTRLAGTVVDATDGSPVAGATVAIEPVTPAPAAARIFGRGATTDDAGAFAVNDVGDGELRVTARKEGYEPAETTVRVAGQDVDGVRLQLAPSAGLIVDVRGPFGAPPAEVQAALLDAAGRPLLQGGYATGENGRVRFTSAPAGRFRLLLASGSAGAALDVTVPGPPLGVTLTPTAELAVTVPALADARVPATLTIAGADGQPLRTLGGFGGVQSEWRGGDGRFLVRGVPAGAWRLTVTTADGRVFQGSATTDPGGRVEVGLE